MAMQPKKPVRDTNVTPIPDAVERSIAEAVHATALAPPTALAAVPHDGPTSVAPPTAPTGMQATVTEAARRTMHDTRAATAQAKALGEEATQSLETSLDVVSKGMAELGAKVSDAFAVNADATVRFAQAMMGVKTLADAVTLQTEHARRQYETLGAQAKDLTEVAQRVTAQTIAPLQAASRKALGGLG